MAVPALVAVVAVDAVVDVAGAAAAADAAGLAVGLDEHAAKHKLATLLTSKTR
jgi:hypothetical protein